MVYQLTPTDSRYPNLLQKLEHRPTQLFVSGSVEVLSNPSIAVVGTRKMTSYGRYVTKKFVDELVACGLTIVSGLALGVDGEAHRAALAAGGKTIAVLAHGLDRVSPVEHRSLAGDILSNNGALLSEFPAGMEAQKYTFVQRNRIIAGMTLGTLVTEAGSKSGAKITANCAAEYGRPVFAVPGPITNQFSEGTKDLVNIGAKVVTSAKDILEELSMSASNVTQQHLFQSDLEKEVFSAISSSAGNATQDLLVRKLHTPLSLLQEPLLMLEMRGEIACVGHTYIAKM